MSVWCSSFLPPFFWKSVYHFLYSGGQNSLCHYIRHCQELATFCAKRARDSRPYQSLLDGKHPRCWVLGSRVCLAWYRYRRVTPPGCMFCSEYSNIAASIDCLSWGNSLATTLDIQRTTQAIRDIYGKQWICSLSLLLTRFMNSVLYRSFFSCAKLAYSISHWGIKWR